MKRSIVVIAAIAAALIGPALVAVPASAGNTTTTVWCPTGSSCATMLERMIHYSGANYSPGANNMVVDIPPPPCLWEPIGNATTGSKAIIKEFGTNPNNAGTQFEVNQSVQQADNFLKQNPPPAGEWYWLPVNDAAGQAGINECLKMPLYVFVPPGQPLPGIQLPPQTMAQLVFTQMGIPGAGQMMLNPTSGKTFTNLPTFVRVTLLSKNKNNKNKNNMYETAPNGQPYVTVTGSLAGTTVTVWAVASRLQVSASGGSGYTPDTSNCGYLGSREINDAQFVAKAGPGTPIDCGVTFQAPATWQITATMNWQACWAPVAGGGLPPANCRPVPGAQLNGLTWTRRVAVNEIQSVNNGNS